MNKIFLLLISLFNINCINFSCSNDGQRTTTIVKNDDTVKVKYDIVDSVKIYKIDSINNFYLIYALKNSFRYKIVSGKENIEECDRIRIDNYYNFELSSMVYYLGDIRIHPGPVGYVNVDGQTKIYLEDSIYDLYTAKNIKSLCFIK